MVEKSILRRAGSNLNEITYSFNMKFHADNAAFNVALS